MSTLGQAIPSAFGPYARAETDKANPRPLLLSHLLKNMNCVKNERDPSPQYLLEGFYFEESQVKSMNVRESVFWSTYSYRDKVFYLLSTNVGMCYISLGEDAWAHVCRWVEKRIPSAELVHDDPSLQGCKDELDQYFGGSLREFSLPLDMRGTPFQVAVWRALLDIPYGQTTSYGDIARTIGRTSGFRAVGAAIGANPLSIVVPCHRVIGKNGSLTGFGGGLELKSQLLSLENPALKFTGITNI